MTTEPAPVVLVGEKPARKRSRGRLPLRVMTGTQAKLAGTAIGSLFSFLWNGIVLYMGGTKDHPFFMPVEIAGVISVLTVTLLDLTLGGKPKQADEDNV